MCLLFALSNMIFAKVFDDMLTLDVRLGYFFCKKPSSIWKAVIAKKTTNN